MHRVKTAHPIMNGYKMQTTYLLVVFAIVVQQTFAGTFPEFITKCKISDPKFDECVLTSANTLTSTIINGDDKYGIPPLLTSNLTRIYNFTKKFGMKFTNLSAHANEDPVITDIHFDFQQKMLTFSAKCAQIELTSDYELVGRGPGDLRADWGTVNMTFDDVELNATVKLDFKTKNDKKYLEAVSCKLIVNGKKFQFKPDVEAQTYLLVSNLTQAEQEKEHQLFIDTIPQLMKNDIEQFDKEPVEALNKIFDLLPFEELFLP